MRTYYRFLFLLLIVSCRSTFDTSLQQDDTLLQIDDKKVSAEEFLYSFNKSFQNNQDSITELHVNDYLQLFVNYKLKVAKAREAGYDTSSAYLEELNHYQDQVKSSYRVTEKMKDELVEEAYERMKYEVNVSHILLQLDENASAEDTLRVYNKIMDIRSSEEDFTSLAKKYSEDISVKENNGELGYFSVFQMVYPFESAAYNTPVGTISMPVRTKYGYHLIKVNDKRKIHPVSLHHIYLPVQSEESENVIFDVHNMLDNGMPIEQLREAPLFIENSVGYAFLPPQRVSQLNPQMKYDLEYLTEKGDLTDPIEINGVWHVFQLEERQELPSFSEIEAQLERMVRSTERLKIYEDQYLEHLLERYEFKPGIRIAGLKDTLNSPDIDEAILFTLAGKTYLVKDFLKQFEDKDIQNRTQEELRERYGRYLKSKVFELEDSQLIERNPDLRWLLKEYEEGMLLFSIMEDSIWNKAVSDTTGLSNFTKMYEENISGGDTLDNRGRLIAAYQEFLEEKWVMRLREEYKVLINQKVLEKIYEKLIN